MIKKLFAILILAAILRLWNLGNVPPHLTSDEAALGYNAYSILKTGRDEYGELLPLIFKSFGDWKPGLFVYITVPFVAIFGLSEWVVRIPGAISGVLAVWLIYLVVGELFKNKKLQILSAALLAISPWHILFSRGAWEINLSLTLTLFGIYFFLRAIGKNPRLIILSAVFFALTLLAYQGAKLSTGLVVLGLLFFFRHKLFVLPRKLLAVSAITGFLIALPIILSIFQGKAGRLEVFSVFSYSAPEKITERVLTQGNEIKSDVSYQIFHSDPVFWARGILGRWMNHYSARFLVFEGDWPNPRHSIPNMGMLLFFDGFLLVCGLACLLRNKMTNAQLFIIYWFLVAPIPAALSLDAVHAVRTFNMVIPVVVIIAFGSIWLFDKIKTLKIRKIVYFLFFTFYCLNFAYFLDGYFIHLPTHNAKFWEYGYKQAVEAMIPIEQNYKTIVFVQSYDQPYIYYLFYKKYDPATYQKIAKLTPGIFGVKDVGFIEQIDKMHFEWIDWPSHRGRRGTLFLGTLTQIPPEDSNDPELFKLVGEIKYPDGNTVFRLVEVL